MPQMLGGFAFASHMAFVKILLLLPYLMGAFCFTWIDLIMHARELF